MKQEKAFMDEYSVRKIMLKHILTSLNNIEIADILQEFEWEEEINEKLKNCSEEEIEKIDADAYKLIKITLNNFKAHAKQFVPLYLIHQKRHRRKVIKW